MLYLDIAKRYLFARKSHSAVNLISLISIAGVAVATAAIVVVLSVFNGFSELAGTQVKNINAPLKVAPVKGHVIADADSLAREISSIEGVKAVSPVIEERGLLIYGRQQMPVVFKGIASDYNDVRDLRPLVVAGEMMDSVNGLPAMTAMSGVANYCGIIPSDLSVAELYVPRRTVRINPANPAASYIGRHFMVTAVSQSQRLEFDSDHIIIPLSEARHLLEYTTEATSVEISPDGSTSTESLEKLVSDLLGPDYTVLSALEQEDESFKMISVEKWITFALLSLILLVAAFNIFSTVSLLIVEKRDNMATLRMLGAPGGKLLGVFGAEGFLVTFIGGICGIVLGLVLSLIQQIWGVIKLQAEPGALTTDVYPVKVLPLDLLAILGLIVVIGLFSAMISRILAYKILKINKNTI